MVLNELGLTLSVLVESFELPVRFYLIKFLLCGKLTRVGLWQRLNV